MFLVHARDRSLPGRTALELQSYRLGSTSLAGWCIVPDGHHARAIFRARGQCGTGVHRNALVAQLVEKRKSPKRRLRDPIRGNQSEATVEGLLHDARSEERRVGK